LCSHGEWWECETKGIVFDEEMGEVALALSYVWQNYG